MLHNHNVVGPYMPVRVAFAVAASSDSMTILDEPGAEDLLGKGNMIFLPKDSSIIRLQSGYVSDKEIERVVNHLRKTYASHSHCWSSKKARSEFAQSETYNRRMHYGSRLF